MRHSRSAVRFLTDNHVATPDHGAQSRHQRIFAQGRLTSYSERPVLISRASGPFLSATATYFFFPTMSGPRQGHGLLRGLRWGAKNLVSRLAATTVRKSFPVVLTDKLYHTVFFVCSDDARCLGDHLRCQLEVHSGRW
jgi:hypothetical protein